MHNHQKFGIYYIILFIYLFLNECLLLIKAAFIQSKYI